MSTIAGAFNGLISYGISKDLEGVNGWRAWRWIFLIEGIMPMAFSFVVLFLLPVSPQSVRFGFNAEEKELMVRRSREAHNSSEARLEVKKVHQVLLSIHFWLFVLIACCSHFATSSLFNFLPDIVHVSILPLSKLDKVSDTIYRVSDTPASTPSSSRLLYTHSPVRECYSGLEWPIGQMLEASLSPYPQLAELSDMQF